MFLIRPLGRGCQENSMLPVAVHRDEIAVDVPAVPVIEHAACSSAFPGAASDALSASPRRAAQPRAVRRLGRSQRRSVRAHHPDGNCLSRVPGQTGRSTAHVEAPVVRLRPRLAQSVLLLGSIRVEAAARRSLLPGDRGRVRRSYGTSAQPDSSTDVLHQNERPSYLPRCAECRFHANLGRCDFHWR